MQQEDYTFKLNGQMIRKLRKDEAISSSELAEKVGVTQAYISQIERNLAEPSLSVLRLLSKALKVELPMLFSYELPSDVLVKDTKEQLPLHFKEGHAKYHFLTPAHLKNGSICQLSSMLVTIEAGHSDYEEKVSHDFVEFCHVLEGEIEYRTADKKYFLSEGDSIYIQPNVPHLVYNSGDKVAKIIATLGSVHPFVEADNS